MKTKVLNGMRWTAFVPASGIAAFLAAMIYGTINAWVAALYTWIEPGSIFYRMIEIGGGCVFGGAAGVYVAYKIAPSKKDAAALVILVLALIISVSDFLITGLIGQSQSLFDSVLRGVGYSAGSIGMYIQLRDEGDV